jgi:hypothetical protein
MSFANPAKIRPGMAAILFGRSYRVIGRAVLGAMEDGRTYFWNEFNLETSGGKYATLVFEESGSGGQWKFFEMFDPQTPMTAAEAGKMQIGNSVNLDGTPLLVTYVDRSRVYAVEGKAPEGVAVGQRAQYFNAEAGDKMIVVSWTGEEVEFYSGTTITPAAVADAFHLTGLARLGFTLTGGRSFLNLRLFAILVAFCIFGGAGFLIFAGVTSSKRPPAVIILPAAPPLLTVGESGVLEERRYLISSHALVEIAEVGLRFSRHEYELSDEDGHHALLFSGAGPNSANWILCAPIEPPPPLSPQKAAALSAGQTVSIGGEAARISKLFLSTIREVDGTSPPARKPGDILYGFSGAIRSNLIIARWNAANITWLQGKVVAGRNVKAAFVQPLEK